MKNQDPRSWMWADAVEMLARADRLQRQFARPSPAAGRTACWEPPVDMLETDREVLVLAALPGVDPARIRVVIVDGVLQISGQRQLPPELHTAVIHRLELPQGRFERQIHLPPGRYEVVPPQAANGCLLVILRKLA